MMCALRILIEFAIQEEHTLVKVRKSVNEFKSDNGFLKIPTYSCTRCRPCRKSTAVCTHSRVYTHPGTLELIRGGFATKGYLDLELSYFRQFSSLELDF